MRPRNSWRTSASAIIVPRIVAITVDSAASSRLVTSASVSSGIANASLQCSSVKPSQVKLNLPAGSLNEKTAITAIGISM